ncbi:unnamed protein product [Phytophthora lilii]|uniref:Unnamed protein product n=1 Tax=Phytophthora lilii TaxID=2077276 RepID=A0A9W6U922_9STRA|nr:unnamed protein product [Phytophthora lilii]
MTVSRTYIIELIKDGIPPGIMIWVGDGTVVKSDADRAATAPLLRSPATCAMFFLKQLSRDLLLHPMHFGPKLHDIIRLRLIEEVEGTSMGKYGYVITVTEVRDEDIGKGVIQDNSGFVCFNIRYRAILFRPFKNQVLDAVVTVVNQLGFFADVGPLQVFVSRHAMPTDLNNGYDHESNAWISDDREVEIRKGCGVRLKIMGVSVDVTEIVSGAGAAGYIRSKQSGPRTPHHPRRSAYQVWVADPREERREEVLRPGHDLARVRLDLREVLLLADEGGEHRVVVHDDGAAAAEALEHWDAVAAATSVVSLAPSPSTHTQSDAPLDRVLVQQLVRLARDAHDDGRRRVLVVVDEPVALRVRAEQRLLDAQLLLDRRAQAQEAHERLARRSRRHRLRLIPSETARDALMGTTASGHASLRCDLQLGAIYQRAPSFDTLTTMATAPLLLAARELARGPLASLPRDAEAVASGASTTHLAVLVRSRTERNCLRLGVFDAAGDAQSELVDLLPESNEAVADQTADSNWTLAWSPDHKFLVVTGQIPRSEGEHEGVLWLFARPEWLAGSTETKGPPLLLRVDPAKYLAAKHWEPTTSIVSAFFPAQSGSKLLVLGEDGAWISVNVQLAKLALVAMDRMASEDTAGLFSMKVVKKLTEWHAGVTAATYAADSSTLVVSGGVKNPSADLVEKQASSLSVWKVVSDKDNKDVAELLDFTMVLKGKKFKSSDDANENPEEADLTSAPIEASGGLLTSVKSSLFAPLKMMVGSETTEAPVIRGSIRHLALAPNGNFVSMVDDLGRIAIRQIDACADVLKWQTVEALTIAKGEGIAMKLAVWLTSDLVALVLTSGRVIYSRFIAHSEEAAVSGLTSSDSDSESASLSGPSGCLVLISTRHHRPATDAASDSIQTLALASQRHPLGDKHDASFSAYELVTVGDYWTCNLVQNTEVGPFVELLMDAKKFEDALATVALNNIEDSVTNADSIHRRIWIHYRNQAARPDEIDDDETVSSAFQDIVFLNTRPQGFLQRGERDDFTGALDHLRAISDKQWVLDECLHLVADDSSTNMKKILDLAWDVWRSLNDGDEVANELSQEKVNLQRFLYRLETLRLLLCEEESIPTTSVAGDQLFDGAAYAVFRSTSVCTTAKQFAREGRVLALTVLFKRHAWNLLPHWLEVLELLPSSVSPSTYASLLPAIAAQMEDTGEFCTLRRSDDLSGVANDDNDSAVPVTLLEENRIHDLTDEELAEFEEYSKLLRDALSSAYCEWFSKRIMELDTRYGQLAFAYDLSCLATKCLSGWSSQAAKRPLEDLFLNTERLYKCVYPLHLSACCLLPLNEWLALSVQDQALIVIGADDKDPVEDVTPIINRLDAIFVSQRRDRAYSLDDLFSWLVQTMSSKSSLTGLTLAAQIIHHSNPSMSFSSRWIQSNTRLIETALDVVFSVTASDIVGEKSSHVDDDVYMQRHLALVEQLWTIFQSLPVRKENDPPEIAQLQVAVDEMEDLMVTMDVLSKYGVVSSPSGLKYRMLASSDVGMGGGTSVGPHGLLEQMCEFALPGEYSDDEDNGDGSQWLEVLQDAVKLKEHAFGERLSQEMILDVILKHLLAPARAYVDAAQNLVNHWIASDVEAVDHVLEELIMAIRTKLDSVTGYSEDANANAAHEAALSCIGIVKQLLSLEIWDEGDRAESGRKQHYEDILKFETDTAHACELLDLLTYGAVKFSPSQLRGSQEEDEEENIRLEAVCQVFVSNPSNYKPSVRAREWLVQHHVGETGIAEEADQWNEPLAAIMQLAKLLRVDSQRLEIWMKGAYAALYCMDYDVAYDLTMHVIDGIPADTYAVSGAHNGTGGKLTLLHLVSLVLDLVSASSFRSWGKKRNLCCALFSAGSVASVDLFTHQVTDLVLAWLEKIEAIQALMIELGLSDNDLEQRRLAGGKTTSSAEAVLLNELKVVVDLLHEEKNDRQFLLRLLQRGFQLTQVMTNNDVVVESEGNTESISTFLQQMVQLCVEEAVELTSNSSVHKTGNWQQYLELGFSYLMLWGDLCNDEEAFEAFCVDKILSAVFIEHPSTDSPVASSATKAVHTSEDVVRRFHHFFLLQLAQGKGNDPENEEDSLLARRKRFETLSTSYEATRRAATFPSDSQNESLDVVPSTVNQPAHARLTVSKQRCQIYGQLAQRCQERLASQKKSHELEQMSTFFNTELDLQRFSQDESYRNQKVMLLATKKEHFQLSKQFANKYGIDEYECVLAYIKHSLLFPPDSSQLGRREQLDQAFRIEQVDVLEEALQRPVAFGDFLLGKGTAGEPSLYEALDGADHVAILLVLRMVLECSKRIYQESAESESHHERSHFPLSKPSADRITLLFMCLKKLKEIGDVLDDVEPVDLKLIGAASTTAELLTPLASSRTDPQAMITNRQVAVQAVRPLLRGKTIKFVTKILRKLHRVTPSSMVMIYINDLLTGIWREHGAVDGSAGTLSADLAAYAYESCVPCLSVLSNEHLMLFHWLFLNGSSGNSPPELVAHLNCVEEFYGQPLGGLQHFGALLTPQKRVELVADTLTLFQTKYNSWQTSGPRSNVSSASSTSSSSSVSWDPAQFKRKEQELHFLERELAENVCCLLLSEIDQSGLTFDANETKTEPSLEHVVTALRSWFAMDSLQQTGNEEMLHSSVLLELCQSVTSIDLATLVMELVLRAGGSKANAEDASNAIIQTYQATVVNLVNRCLGTGEDEAKRTVQWAERLAWAWASGSNVPNSNQMTELGCYLHASLSRSSTKQAQSIYERVLTLLTQSPSTLLKEIGMNRLGEMQTPADGVNAESVSLMASEAVLHQWEQLVLSREEQQRWTEAAVLSHVLVTYGGDKVTDSEATNWYFGLHAKAVWSALLTKHKIEVSGDSPHILEVPSRDILEHFTPVFEELLAFVELQASDDSPRALRFAEVATVALSYLLVRHDDAHSDHEGAAQRSASAWQSEQKRAVRARIHTQFQVGEPSQQPISADNEDATSWIALFARGVWGARLLSWYTAHAYAELSGDEEATEAVILAHWEANNIDVAIQLLLMCPFDNLREKYAARALTVVRQFPRGSSSWSTAMELALLRFDVGVLLQHGLHSAMVAFVLQESNRHPALWTSSGDYVVCALVSQGEFAAAGRLTCALCHAHPLLWDVENARLLLANHLRSLASPAQHKSHKTDVAELEHEVYVQTSRQFASALL